MTDISLHGPEDLVQQDGAWRRKIGMLLRWLLGTPAPRQMASPPTSSDLGVESGEAQQTVTPIALARSEKPTHANATARVIAAFDAAHPVRQRKDLYGRDGELETLFEAVLFSRQHAIVHGARGSGKTSLAQVFGDYADQQGAVVIYTACEASSSFAELMRPYLGFIPESCVPFAEKHNFQRERDILMPTDFGPRSVVDLCSRLAPECQIILILDEFDRVEDETVNNQAATLLKLLSDARLPIQVLLVGIARTLEDLILCHPSLRRHLVPIAIGRISREDTDALIVTGARRAGVTFDDESRVEIADISCGSPYHVQLFCYVAALEAVRQGRDIVDRATCRNGFRRAFETWAMLNPEDAEIFQSLASADLDTRARVQRIAREGATRDCVTANEELMNLLGPALVRDRKRAGRAVFRDVAAPQFLLAVLALHHGAKLKAM